MTFELPGGLGADEELFVEVLDDLTVTRVAPAAAEIDATGTIDPALVALLAAQGFLGPLADPGDGVLLDVLLVERLARGSAALAAVPAGIADCRAAFPAGRAPTGEWRPTLVDAGAGALTADPDGPGWRLGGYAARVEWAAEADTLVVIATVDGEPAVFSIDRGALGVESGPIETTSGLHGLPVRGVIFRDVRVDDADIVGDVRADNAGGRDRDGATAAAEAARRHRALTSAAMAVGLSAAAVEAAIAYAGERRQFGRSLSEFGAIRALVADMESRTAAAAELLWAAARCGDVLHGTGRARAARAARVAIEAALSVTRDAVQVHGGYGYIREQPVERAMRDAMSVAARAHGTGALLDAVASGTFGG